ncbi:MAG: TonB-dependent receptor [Pseudomonadales bacterium]|nr:hypothetical protein [Pseudomonadales bacterium]MCP5331334.1 TonB-dependent receptor [Pseudomonadales bacterium]MCP5344344.1 TonB-dependent receptor [Pseudomonadales bacterium]
MDRKYVLTSLGYAIVGLLLGIYMAASQDHGQYVTHAHIMLLGFVVSFVYAALYRIWLNGYSSKLVSIQYLAHQVGTLVLLVGLFCLYGGLIAEEVLGPIMGVFSILVLLGMILMKVIFIKASKSA